MFRLRLDARQCLCCAICMDVCAPQAIGMRPFKKEALEGPFLCYLALNSDRNIETPPGALATFPFMANTPSCDGCRLCVNECPTNALELRIT